MENKTPTVKMPLVLRINKAQSEAVRAINAISAKYELPYFELESILYRLYQEAQSGACRERAQAEINYQRLIAENLKESEESADADSNHQKGA